MANDPATGAIPEHFDRIGAQATESLRGDARRMHDLAEEFRARYRRDLEDWMQLRARLDRLIFCSIQRSSTVFLNFQRLPSLKAGI